MFGWFNKKHQALQPENKWVITVEGDHISVCDDTGQAKSIAESDLSGVAIETNDSGPWGADVWWLLLGAAHEIACAFPQGATGEDAVIAWLSKLPSFDHGEMIKAMRSTDNAVFAVWRRKP
ncbi:MAG TPA: hypothetical protein VM532_15515 [Burkholderiales bacterium]|jgi:hypothetical protein|nr:hypothetical protein [Burkholderiales bacterium]